MLIFNGGGRRKGGGQWSGGLGGKSLNMDAETEALKMIGQRSNLYSTPQPKDEF